MKIIKHILFVLCLLVLASCVSTPSPKPSLKSISVIDMPEKVEIGKFDEAGIKLELLYSDNRYEKEDFTCVYDGRNVGFISMWG